MFPQPTCWSGRVLYVWPDLLHKTENYHANAGVVFKRTVRKVRTCDKIHRILAKYDTQVPCAEWEDDGSARCAILGKQLDDVGMPPLARLQNRTTPKVVLRRGIRSSTCHDTAHVSPHAPTLTVYCSDTMKTESTKVIMMNPEKR